METKPLKGAVISFQILMIIVTDDDGITVLDTELIDLL